MVLRDNIFEKMILWDDIAFPSKSSYLGVWYGIVPYHKTDIASPQFYARDNNTLQVGYFYKKSCLLELRTGLATATMHSMVVRVLLPHFSAKGHLHLLSL